MPTARLTDRSVLGVSGEESRAFLDRLVTCAVEPVGPGRSAYGALLTPQGKVLADFVIHADAEGFLLDVPSASVSELAKRLSLYRLRAKVQVEDLSGRLAVFVGWDGAVMPEHVRAGGVDPRLPDLGWRAVVAEAAEAAESAESADAGEAAYHGHRIALAVPEMGRDGAFGDTFPHETLMDQTGGVDFRKGCYIGQEVVSRMQHRGTARTRIVPLDYPDGVAAPPGTEVSAGERSLGRTASAVGGRGLATLRLDRVGDALAAGQAITVEGRPVRLVKPGWIRFPFPGEPVPT